MTFSKANQKSKLKTDLVVVTKYDDLYLFQINLTVFLTDRFKYQSFLQIVSQSGCVNLIDSHAFLQSSHSCKLNTVVGVVELTYLHVVVKCESLLGGRGKARCTVITIALLPCLSGKKDLQ